MPMQSRNYDKSRKIRSLINLKNTGNLHNFEKVEIRSWIRNLVRIRNPGIGSINNFSAIYPVHRHTDPISVISGGARLEIGGEGTYTSPVGFVFFRITLPNVDIFQ